MPRVDEAEPLVTSFAEAIASSPATEEFKSRKWIRHRVRARERVSQIAARYGVERSDLVEWNRLATSEVYAKTRRTLKVLTDRQPPPRIKVRYLAVEGEGWMDIAAKFRVGRRDLMAWNWRRRKLVVGRELEMWVDPTAGSSWKPGSGPVPPVTVDIPPGALSVGKPNRGRLENGAQLPESELYSRGPYLRVLFGSTHTLKLLQQAFARFRHESGYTGDVVIGSMSRSTGRRLKPHRSHQSGRDVDIRLPRLMGVPKTNNPNRDEIDWYAAWVLIRAFVKTGQAGRIFLNIDLHELLYEAARTMGHTAEELRDIIQWPSWTDNRDPVVRHADGHDGHIHVRIKCGPDEPKCRRA